MEMVDKDGNVIDVPDEQAGDAFRSGQYGFQRGAQIPVVNDVGKVGTIDAEEAASAFRTPGLATVSQDTLKKAATENKFGGAGGSAAAFGINAGDALTLGFGKGLATQAAGAIGGDAAEERTRNAISGYDEANPNAAFAGQVAGTAAPLVPGGVEGIIGKGARGLGAGVRGVDSLGSLAEAGTRALVGEGAENFVARAGQKALAYGARGALEGSIYGTGSAYSQAILKDEDLTAERLMAGAEHGAIMGGTIGAGIGGASSLAASAIGKFAETVVPKLRDSLEDFAEQRAFKAAGGSKRFVTKAMDRAGGAEEISKDLLARGHINYGSTTDSIAESVAADAQQQGQKLGNMMRELDAKAATTEGQHLVQGDKLLKRAYDEVITPLRNNPAMRDVGDQLEARLAPYVEDFAGKEVGHAKLWDIRKGLDQRINWESRAQSPLADGLKDFRRILEGELTDSADKAARELGISDTFAKDWKETKRLYSSLSFSRDMAEDAIARKEGNRFFSLTDNLAGGFGASSFASHSAGEGGHGLGALSLLNPQAALSGVLTAAAHKVLRERGSSIMATAADRLAKIGSVAEQANSVETKVVEGIDKFLTKGTKKAIKLAAGDPDAPGAAQSGVVQAAANIFGRGAKEPKTIDGKFSQASRAVAQLSSQPAAAAAHMERTLAPVVQKAPSVALKVATKQTQAIKFLQSKLPPEAHPSPLSPAAVKSVGDMDKASFLRSLRAVRHPLSIIEDLHNGTLSTEGVEALENVYPGLLEDTRSKVASAVMDMAAKGEEVSYSQRLQLSTLFGVPTDPTQAPEVVSAVQSIYATMGSTSTDGPNNKTPGGAAPARKVDTAGAHETRVNELEGKLG